MTKAAPHAQRTIRRQRDQTLAEVRDDLAVEEPLEIRVEGRPVAVTMRTPGHDVELALGLLVSEGVIRDHDDVIGARHCAGENAGSGEYNVLDVALEAGVRVPDEARHALTMTSACGLCGKDSIDAVRARSVHPVEHDPVEVEPAWLAALPD